MTCFTEIRALLQCLEPTLSLRWACIWKVAQCLRIRLKRSISERLQGGWGGSGTPCCEVVGPEGFPAPPGEQGSPANLCVGRQVIRMEPGSRPDHRPWIQASGLWGSGWGATPTLLTIGADHAGVLVMSAVASHPAQG